MGAKPSNFNQTNPMATNIENHRDLEGIREQDRQKLASTEKHDEESMIPEHGENPELTALREKRDRKREEGAE